MSKVKIGYIGPGLMGAGIIANLLKGGLEVTICRHRRGMQLGALQKAGAAVTSSLSELAAGNNMIMLTTPSSKEVEQLILGKDGLAHSLRSGSVVIDFGTSLPSSTRMLARRLGKRKIEILDAPMTRGPAAAAEGKLNLMVGGKKSVYKKCLPILQLLAENIFYIGKAGSGHTVKLINNFLGQLNSMAVAEVLPLAMKAGVDIDALFGAISVSGGNSAVFQQHVPMTCRRDFAKRFAIRLCHKDIHYMRRLGLEYNVPLPMANSTAGVLDLAMANGLGGETAHAVIKMWEKLAGVKVSSACKTARNDGVGKSG